MKKNYDNIKENIQKCKNEIQKHYDLSDAIFHLSAALAIVEQREKKETRRKVNALEMQSKNNISGNIYMDLNSAKKAVALIDKLVEFENKKIIGKDNTTQEKEMQTLND